MFLFSFIFFLLTFPSIWGFNIRLLRANNQEIRLNKNSFYQRSIMDNPRSLKHLQKSFEIDFCRIPKRIILKNTMSKAISIIADLLFGVAMIPLFLCGCVVMQLVIYFMQTIKMVIFNDD